MFNLLQVIFLLLAAMEYQTNVINAQPQVTVTQYTVSRGSSEWSTNACDCCEDCGICLCGTFVPCILACQVAQDSDESCCLACLPGALIALRTSIRNRYNIGVSVVQMSNHLLNKKTRILIMNSIMKS
uniref:Cornifelin n=1 Tax=Haplochromis burtoni TaxID=8153 RepID=A0A3Q2VY48_HAPBU